MANVLDIVVFGATGFTGKYTLPYVYKLAKSEGRALTWGIAGRSEQKLKDILVEIAERIGVDDLNQIPIIIADVNDEDSIKRMTGCARMIINCCGPFNLYGEVVVKSCIATGTHHVDVSGEPLFVEGMKIKYGKAAEEKGVFIIGACGVDCIPTDMGVVYLENQFKGTLNSVEVYIQFSTEGDHLAGPRVNYGTWASLVDGARTLLENFYQHKSLYPNALPTFEPKLSQRFPIHKSDVDNKWAVPFLGMDREVVLRSQRYFFEEHRKRPIQTHCYAVMDSFFTILFCAIYGFIILILSQISFGRNLLLKYPALFSLGFISHEDPSEDVLERSRFTATFYGRGWSENLAEGDDQYQTPPNMEIVGQVSGSNPAYAMTAAGVALCGIIILTESKKLPAKGGVYTTAGVFSKTSLIEQLQKNEYTFKILSTKDL